LIDAIILAAGKGTRLMPITQDKPKAMVEVKGKPIISWILDVLKQIQIKKVFIITGYREGTLKSYIKYNYKDMDINFLHQKELTGTADAIALAEGYIGNNFLVLSGDTIYKPEELMKLMEWENSLLYTEQNTRLYEYGTIDLNTNKLPEEGFYLKFINEKTTRPTTNNINCGVYHFNREVFRYIRDTEYDGRFSEKIITNTINMMIDDGIDFRGFYVKELNEISRPEDIENIENRL